MPDEGTIRLNGHPPGCVEVNREIGYLPERLSFDVADGDSYRFWIVNAGPGRETGTFVANLVFNHS